jgi:hypothetical protein
MDLLHIDGLQVGEDFLGHDLPRHEDGESRLVRERCRR